MGKSGPALSSHGQRWLLAIVVAGMAVFTLPAANAQTTVLRWKWTPGDVLRYRINQEMTQTKTGLEEMQVSWTVQYIVRQEVKEVSGAGLATIEQTYESGTVTAHEDPGEKVRYDSANPGDKDKAGHRLIAPYAAFIGKTITFDIGPEGEVPRLEGATAIMDEALANLKTDPMTAALVGQFRDSLGDEAVRRQFEMAMRVVPDRSCKTGDTWKVAMDQDMPIVGTLRHDVTYKLRRLAARGGTRMAMIEGAGGIAQAGAAGGQAEGLGALSGLLDVKLTRSKIDAEVAFDIEHGRIEESSYAVESDWEFGLKGLDLDAEDALPGEMAGFGKGAQQLVQRATMERIP